MTDYRRLMCVEDLFSSSNGGEGVKIAVLDSGYPRPFLKVGHQVDKKFDHDDKFGHASGVSTILFGGKWIPGLCEAAEPYYIAVLDNDGSGTVDSVADGIYEAIDLDVDIINLSLGFFRTEKCPKRLEKACQAAFDAKKPIICAAGNDSGPVNWPAALKTTISVGSSDKNSLKTAFSSVGEVDFVAPGVNLSVFDASGREKKVSGTSFSAAIVTGVSALLVNDIRQNEGKFGVDELRSALKDFSVDVDDEGWDPRTGFGLISGKIHDSTVCMKNRTGIFDRMICKIQGILGFGQKGVRNGGRKV